MCEEILTANWERHVSDIKKVNKQLGNSAPGWGFPHILIKQELKLFRFFFFFFYINLRRLFFFFYTKVHFHYTVNEQGVVAVSVKCCRVVWLQIGDLAPEDQVELYQRLRFERGVYCGQWLAACYFRSHVSQWQFCSRWPQRVLSFTWLGRSAGLRGLSLPDTINRVVFDGRTVTY